MQKEIIVNSTPYEVRVAILEDKELVEHLFNSYHVKYSLFVPILEFVFRTKSGPTLNVANGYDETTHIHVRIED